MSVEIRNQTVLEMFDGIRCLFYWKQTVVSQVDH
jgi:hypothetical protein